MSGSLHWITLQLVGTRTNRDAIGARVRVRLLLSGGATRDVYVTVSTGGSFGSTSLQQEIGLGDAAAIDYVEVLWPGTGLCQLLKGLDLDSDYRVRESDNVPERLSRRAFDLSPEEGSDARPVHAH